MARDDQPYYVADGSNTSSDGKTIQCPRCESGVVPSFPEVDCTNCGQTITFVVAKKGSIPPELADWEAAQTEFHELRTQIKGQEDFIQEHDQRLDEHDQRLTGLKEKVQRLTQFEQIVSDRLEELEDDDAE